MQIFKSATKITLLLFAITVCFTTIYLVARNWNNTDLLMSFVGIFQVGIGLVFGFYFRNSSTNSETENKEIE